MKKKYFVLLLCLLVMTVLRANQTVIISGKYRSESKIILKIYEPTNTYYNGFFSNNLDSPNKLQLIADSFYFKTSLSAPATFLLYITDDDGNYLTKAVVILIPGDSLHLNVDLHIENYEEIVYSGSNPLGHKLFNDLNHNPVENTEP